MDPVPDLALLALSKTAQPKMIKWFDNACDRLELKYKTIMMNEREHFMKYLSDTNERFSQIRPVGFTEKLNFLKVYVPLSIKSDREEQEFLIDSFPKELVAKQKHLLIVDNAGMGKSTISKRMFMGAYEDGSCGIPIYIELRHLTQDHGIIKEIRSQIGNLSDEFDEKILEKFLEEGRFVIFLDGYDEISLNEKQQVTKALLSFVRKVPNNIFILTSRQDSALAGFQTFTQYSIKPMEEEDAYRLLSNLDKEGEKSKMLIDRLNKGSSGVEEFLENPLLVTLLFTTFDYTPEIPTKKHLFYEQIYDALFQRHDLSKGDGYIHDKRSKLDKEEFERVLRCVGFSSVVNHKVEFTKDEIIKIIDLAKSKCSCKTFRSLDFLNDLIHAVPIFIHEGLSYKWAHKSLSEYFAVKYLAYDAMEMEGEYVKQLYSDERNPSENIFDLYYDIKPLGFNQFLLLPCLEEIQHELLSKEEEKEKILLSTRLIGCTIHICKKSQLSKHNGEGIFPTYMIRKLIKGYDVNSVRKSTSKWWNVLNIIIGKRCLFAIEDYEIRKEPTDLPHLKNLLAVTDDLVLDSLNIANLDTEVVEEICYSLFLYYAKRIRYLTREDCEEKIIQIRREMGEGAKGLSSWKI